MGIMTGVKAALDRNRLGELLVIHGMITPGELRHALAVQKADNTPLGRVLVRQNMIRQSELYRVLAMQTTMRFMAAAITVMIAMSAFNVKPAKAASIKDIPAGISLVNVANAAFGSLDAYPALFGSQERHSGNLKPFTKWTSMFERFESDMQSPANQKIISKMTNELESLKGQSLNVMAERVNTIVNRTPYINDSNNWGQSDYWATPVEFLKRGGDCEDFAITKYVSLRALGVPESRMRIAIVHDMQKNIPHAILIVYTDTGAMILDNQMDNARYANDINRYRPIFSINRTGWWLHTAPKGTQVASIQ